MMTDFASESKFILENKTVPYGIFKLLDAAQMVGNSMRGVEESIGVISSGVDDEDMLFPCLEITLKVHHCLYPFSAYGDFTL